MNFSPAFAFDAIRKLTPHDLCEIAIYLGVNVEEISDKELEQHLERMLGDQNQFLTANLLDSEITQSSEYHRSAFIREIVENNRRNAEGFGCENHGPLQR